jgi:Divergent InlB B-repeat domain
MTAARLRPRLAVFGFLAVVIALSLALVAPAGAAAATHTLNIEFEGSGSGEVECEVNEGGLEPCEEEYEEGDEVNIYAEEEEGSEFIEFYGDCGPLVCELEMDEDHTAYVVFEAEPVYLPLEIVNSGSGTGEVECEVEGGGAEECEDEYLEGTEINLVAEADEDSEFVEWGDGCEAPVENECEVEMDEEKEVEVVFDLAPEEFELTIEEGGTGTGEVICETEEGPELCEETYPEGTEVYLIAQADPESHFVAWEGECDNVVANECEVEMTEDKTVEAVFDLEEYELEVQVTGEGEVNASEPPTPTSGEISGCEASGGECEATYTEGDVVPLAATPEAGWEVSGWTGCAEVGSEACEVTIDADKTVEVTFVEIPAPEEYELEVEVSGNGKVSANTGAILNCRESSGVCSDEYVEGTAVTLTETPDGGNEFVGWEGCDSEPSATTCKVTMGEAKLVEAEFAVEPEEEEEGEEESGGGGGGGSTPPPAPAPAPPPIIVPGTATAAGVAKVNGAKGSLKISCAGGTCNGSFKLTAKVKQGKKSKNKVVGKGSFSLVAGASSMVKVKITNGQVKKLIKKGKAVKTKLSGTGIKSRTVKLKPAKKKHKRGSKRHHKRH